MSTKLYDVKCCGMWEMDGLSQSETPVDALKAIETDLKKGYTSFFQPKPSGRLKPFVLFTGVVQRKTEDHASNRTDDYGQKFADFVVMNGLGPVVSSELRKSHTQNVLQAWIWHPDYDALNKFYDSLPKPEPEPETPF